MGGEAGRAPSGGLRSSACSRTGWVRHHHHHYLDNDGLVEVIIGTRFHVVAVAIIVITSCYNKVHTCHVVNKLP